MLPLIPIVPVLEILGTAVAGLFLSACAGSQKEGPAPLPQKPEPEPKLDFGEADHPLSYRLLQEITKTQPQISLKIFDQGYQVINFGYASPEGGRHCKDPRAPSCLKSKGDGTVLAEELWETALADSRFREAVEKTLGFSEPWLLDDFDPKTSFDEGIRNKIYSAIKELDKILRGQGLKPEQVEYQRQMAFGMYYFVALPSLKEMKDQPEFTENFLRELDLLPIKGYKSYLEKNGGLRLHYEENFEYSALEALKKNTGACTELSKILYGAMSMAGLKPIFVSVNPWKTDLKKLKDLIQQNPGYGHVCVGLRLGSMIQLLDPNLILSNPPHQEFYLLSLRSYLSLDILNQTEMYHELGSLEKSRVLLDEAHEIDPTNPVILMAMGMDRTESKDIEAAVALTSQAIQLDPHYPAPYLFLAKIWIDGGKSEMAMAPLDKLLKLYPEMSNAYWTRAIAWAQLNDLDKTLQDFQHAVELNGRNPNLYQDRASVFFSTKKYPEAIADLKKSIALGNQRLELYFILGNAYMLLGEWKDAIASLDTYIEKRPSDFQGYLQRGVAQLMAGEMAGAERDAEEALRLSKNPFGGVLLKGWIKWEGRQREKAWEDLAQALNSAPEGAPEFLTIINEILSLQWMGKPEAETLRTSLEQETDLDVINAEANSMMAGVLWHKGEEARAREGFKLILEVPLNKEGKRSVPAKKFLNELFQFLPEKMQRDPEIQTLHRRLNSP